MSWPQSQPALEAPCVVLPVITADKLLPLKLMSPAGCQPWGPRLRRGSPFILIRGTPCVIKKSVYYCRHALTATSIIVKRQMGGGRGRGGAARCSVSGGQAQLVRLKRKGVALLSLTPGLCDSLFLSRNGIFGSLDLLAGLRAKREQVLEGMFYSVSTQWSKAGKWPLD